MPAESRLLQLLLGGGYLYVLASGGQALPLTLNLSLTLTLTLTLTLIQTLNQTLALALALTLTLVYSLTCLAARCCGMMAAPDGRRSRRRRVRC